MSTRNKFSIVLIITSLLLLVPGVTQPILTLSVKNQVAEFLTTPVAKELIEKIPPTIPIKSIIETLIKRSEFSVTRNIVQSISDLSKNGYWLIAGLILFFSILVPVFKSAGILYSIFRKPAENPSRTLQVVKWISKWAMAEVFVVAILIAYFSLISTSVMDARLEVGFYWFLAYCLISNLGTILAESRAGKPTHSTAESM